MQDILLRATHEAQSIIEDCLNGYNYGITYSILKAHLQKILDKKIFLCGVKSEAEKVASFFLDYLITWAELE